MRRKTQTVKNTGVVDFETTPEGDRIWLWDVCKLEDYSHVNNTNMNSFIDYLYESEIENYYFHNLGFDSEFLISWLMNNYFVYRSLDDSVEQDGSFDTIVSDKGKVYQIRLFIISNGKYRIISIFDSINKIPMSVEDIADKCNMDIGKLEIDYNRERDENYVPDDSEYEYIRHDTEIVAKALRPFIEMKMNGMTIGIDALKSFKSQIGVVKFQTLFPCLGATVDEFCRQSYKGAIIKVREDLIGVDLEEGLVCDCNSMYPYHLTNNPIPIGIPVYYQGQYEKDSDYPLYIQSVIVTAHLKDNHIACISGSHIFSYTSEYCSEFEDCHLVLTSVDMQVLFDNYVVEDILYVEGYKFHAMSVEFNCFKTYVDKYMGIKSTSSGVERLIAKLMLNSLIGKFATKPHDTSRIPVLEDGILNYKSVPASNVNSFSYVALPAFVNSYARQDLSNKVHLNYSRFIYCDTDCLHLTGYDLPIGIPIDNSELGKWKIEARYDRARYLANKCYIYTVESGDGYEDKITCSGLSKIAKSNLDYEHFISGFKVDGNLRKKRVRGGCILQNESFILP